VAAGLDWDRVIQLVLDFLPLSLIAVGGGATVLPEMQRSVVDVHGWMTATQFSELFGLANAAPGPNVLVVTLIGWQVAGLPGALATTLALCLPSSLLTFGFFRLWQRFRDTVWVRAIERGMAPLTVGLVLASGYLITRGANDSPAAYAATALTVGMVLATRLNPLWLIAGGAIAGITGLL
jgi:chromate transporter